MSVQLMSQRARGSAEAGIDMAFSGMCGRLVLGLMMEVLVCLVERWLGRYDGVLFDVGDVW